jgi:hypothetical protein
MYRCEECTILVQYLLRATSCCRTGRSIDDYGSSGSIGGVIGQSGVVAVVVVVVVVVQSCIGFLLMMMRMKVF